MRASLTGPALQGGRSATLPLISSHLCAVLLATSSVQAALEITISPEQMQRIGINLVPVEVVESNVTDHLPARVSIPPQQARVVSAPRGGLVTALTAAESDEVQTRAVLAHIESPGLVGMQRELLQATTQLRLAEAEFERNEQLFQKKDGLGAGPSGGPQQPG